MLIPWAVSFVAIVLRFSILQSVSDIQMLRSSCLEFVAIAIFQAVVGLDFWLGVLAIAGRFLCTSDTIRS